MINQVTVKGIGGYVTISKPLDHAYLITVNGKTVQISEGDLVNMIKIADVPFKPFPEGLIKHGKLETR